MIIVTIIIGIIALTAARAAGITDTWLGTGAVTGIILYMAIAALPQAQWLFDNLWLCIALWGMATTFYHRLLTDARRCAPINTGRRAVLWRWGRYVVAVGVTA